MPRLGRYTGGGDTDLGTIAPGTMRVYVLNIAPEAGWASGVVWRGGRNGSANSAAQAVVLHTSNQQPTERVAYTSLQVMSTIMTSGSEGATYSQPFIETTQAYSPLDSHLKLVKGRRYAVGLFVPSGYGVAGHGMIQGDLMDPSPDSIIFYDDQGLSSSVPVNFQIDASQPAGWMTAAIEYIANRAPTCTVDTPATNTASPLLSGDFVDSDIPYGDQITKYRFRVRRVSDDVVMWLQNWTNSSPSDQAGDSFENTYAGTALVPGIAYKVDAQVSDEHSVESGWSTAKIWTYSATGTVTMSGTITGKQTTLTPGPFGFRWFHQAALGMTAARIQILDGTSVVRQSGIIAKTVASSAAPGTLSSLTWADTGFTALTTGKVYTYKIEGRDVNGVWSGYAGNPVTFTTNAPPGKPSAMSPAGGVYVTTLPAQASFVMTDPDDSPGAGLNATLEITRPDLTIVTVAPTYNATTQRWETNLTVTQLNQPGLYSVRARGTDTSQSGPWSDTTTFYYAVSGNVTVVTPGSGATITTGTPTFSWTFSGTQASWRIFVYRTDTQVLEYDTGYVTSALTSHQIPVEYPLEEGAYQAYIEIIDNLGNLSGSSARNFTVDLPSATAIQSIQLFGYRGTMDPGESGVLIRWAQSSIAQNSFVQYIIERKAVNESDDPDGRITIAKITEVDETTWIDYYARDRVEYIYYVRQDYKSGTDTIRSDAITAQISIRLRGISIGLVANPEIRIGSRYWDQREVAKVKNKTIQVPWGAKLPTVLADPTNYRKVRIRLRFVDDNQYLALDYMEMLNTIDDNDGAIVCYRDPKRRKIFGTITDFSETDERGGIIGVSLEITQTNFREEVPKGIGMGA